MRDYAELPLQVECLGQIHDIIMRHWAANAGNVHGIKELWAVIHQLGSQEWQAIITCADLIARADPKLMNKHPKLWQDIDEIQERMRVHQPITWPSKREYNLVPFRTLMAMKDIVNSICNSDLESPSLRQKLFE